MRAGAAGAALLLLAGCRKAPPAVSLPPVAPPTVRVSGDGSLTRAASQAKDACPDLLDRVSFTPGQIEMAVPKLESAMKTAAGAGADEYSPRSPFEVDERQKSWRLIGRAYAWKAEAAIEDEDWPRAVGACVDAHRFAAVMAGGDAADASIGMASAAEARAVLAPRLPQMPPEALQQLTEGLRKALASMPPVGETLANEAKRARLAVQHLQDQYTKRDIAAIKSDYGRKAKDSIAALERMDGNQAGGFFQSLAAESDLTAAWYSAQSENPTSKRTAEQSFGTGRRPWADFSHHIYQPMASYVQMRDIFMARTRLLAVSANIEAQIKATGRAPSSLKVIDPNLRVDPYTGEDFRYRSAQDEYRLYSAGEDGMDSGGDSDDSGLTPDLVLER